MSSEIVHGDTANLKSSQARQLQRFGARQVPPQLVISAVLARDLIDLSQVLNRQLGLFIDRLQAQANGTLPFAADPLLQHRLVAAVFDATDLGPTPLRPLAVTLRERLDPLARGPVDRFLAHYGEVRPANR